MGSGPRPIGFVRYASRDLIPGKMWMIPPSSQVFGPIVIMDCIVILSRKCTRRVHR